MVGSNTASDFLLPTPKASPILGSVLYLERELGLLSYIIFLLD